MKLKAFIPVAAAAAAGGSPVALQAQSITVAPALAAPVGAASIPVDNPVALAAVGVALVVAAWFVLRNREHRGLLMVLWGTALVASTLWFSPELRAQAASSFTNPAGETQTIPVTQVKTGAIINGFVPVDFTNSTGVAMKVTALQEPTLPQCFPAGFAFLNAPGAPSVSPVQCAVGSTVAAGGACRVNVETLCRDEVASAVKATLAVFPATVSVNEGSLEVITVSNNGLVGAENIGVAVVPGVSVWANTCGAMLPVGNSCTITINGTAAGGPYELKIGAYNALAETVSVTVVSTNVNIGAYHIDGTCGVLGIQGPGFTLTAGAGEPLPVGTIITVTGTGVANIGVFSVTGGAASETVLSNTQRQFTLTSALPAGATMTFRTTLSISVAFGLNATTTLPSGYYGTGDKPSGSVSSTLILCSAF